VASNGAGGRVLAPLRTTRLRGTFTLKNALKSGHFSPFSAGPLLQQHKHPAARSLNSAEIEVHCRPLDLHGFTRSLDRRCL